MKRAPTPLQRGRATTNKFRNISFLASFLDYCELIPVVPVMMVMMMVRVISVVMPVMMVAIVMMVVTMMIAVPSCGWDHAAGRDCANNT